MEIRQITAIINVNGYRKWFESLEPVDTKHTITLCMDNSTKHSLRMAICCGKVSEEIIGSIQRIICSKRNDNNFYCQILQFLTRPENMKILFKIIEISNICRAQHMCPLDFPTETASTTRNLHVIQKRQFDLASTFDTIRQFACNDVLNGSIIDAWSHILVQFFNDPAKAESYLNSNYFLAGTLLRKPACCLVKVDL